jgi:hypothetical protein
MGVEVKEVLRYASGASEMANTGDWRVGYYLIDIFRDMDVQPTIKCLHLEIRHGIVELNFGKRFPDRLVYSGALVALVS